MLPDVVFPHKHSNDIDGTYYCAGTLEQSMGARNQVGIGLSYRPARLHRLAESMPRSR
jgi:hypothetical protein